MDASKEVVQENKKLNLWRDLVLWIKVIFLVRRSYISGDTNRSYWQKTLSIKLWFVYYRVVHWICTTFCVIYSVSSYPQGCDKITKYHAICIGSNAKISPSWPFYLTTWGLMFNGIQSLLSAILILKAYDRQSKHPAGTPEDEPPSEHKLTRISGFYWGIHSSAIVLSTVITVVYWTLLYHPAPPELMDISRVIEHVLNSIIMYIDYAMISYPVILNHFFILLIASIMYAVTSLIYYLCGGRDFDYNHNYLYPFINWQRPFKAILVVILMQFCSFFVFLLLMVVDHFKHQRRFRPASEGLSSELSILSSSVAMRTAAA